MRALSLTQPWAWIVLHLNKRCENRRRNIGNYRGDLLLHAAQRMTKDDYDKACSFVFVRIGLEEANKIPDFDSPELVRGAIVGRCLVVNQCDPGGVWAQEPGTFFRHEPACWKEDQEYWYTGFHAYIFEHLSKTRVVPCKGALGFWRPPPAIAYQAIKDDTAPGWLELSDAERERFITKHELAKGLAA